MRIVTNLIPKGSDALTVWPFRFVRPKWANDVALREHELVHYREQRACLVVPWWARYLLSPKFRLEAEARAYAVQIQHGLKLDEAVKLLTGPLYELNITADQARAALAATKD